MTAPSTIEPRQRTERGAGASAFWALSLAIVRGFLRDKASVFFAIVFPLMFLVLFGGLFADPSQSKVDLIEVGHVAFLDEMPKDARAAFEQTFEVTTSNDLAASHRGGPQGRRRRGPRACRATPWSPTTPRPTR